MTGYQKVIVEDLIQKNTPRYITPYKKANLLEEITKSGAFWFAPTKSKNNYDIPLLYHVILKGQEEPMEFINNKWYFIQWNNNKYKGYWLFPSQKIK
jgi:hypothetical protein